MKNRWKMNRIGFVNFWLYDEEIIDLTDGKLLLRGQNGSGKSITTQSFIPFILDGDRTPSRLDPFGSSDRRMEYYFLGEEGRDEATGYLFLEFKKELTEEYRTIGIGQRARRGKAMDFWGFVILDGRRIGYDFWLYRETGSTRLPYSKQELKKELGEETPFSEVPGEYKAMVNKYIFGFRRLEQYEQFIRLLVKVRAPKLSKEFKPTKVYEILNESLQTLTDEDLRAMVDAMEKMDGIQESLAQLNRAFGDVKIIRNEYRRYNQFMLARKGQAYLDKKREAEQERERLEAQEAACRQMLEEITEKSNIRTRVEERLALAETELISLLDTDMEEADRKLDKAREDRADAEGQKTRWEEAFEQCHVRIRESEELRKKLQTELEIGQEQLEEEAQALCEEQEQLHWERHDAALTIIGQKQESQLDEIENDLRSYERQIDEGLQCIVRYQELQAQYDLEAEALEQARRKKEDKEQEVKELREEILNEQDRMIVELYQMKSHQEWIPEQEILLEAEKKIKDYQRAGDAGKIRELLQSDWERQRMVLLDERHACELQRQKLIGERDAMQEELLQVQQQEELEPPRDQEVLRFRRELSQAGIPHVPFFKAVEFAEGLSAEEQARLEAQLIKAGVLDALVVSPADQAVIHRSFPQMLDCIIRVEGRGDSGFHKLEPSTELSETLREEVLRILSHIGVQEEGGSFFLDGAGYFRQGILFGRADREQAAEYIGREARRRKKEQRIRTLQEELEQLQKQLELVGRQMEVQSSREKLLEAEHGDIPDFEALNRLVDQQKAKQLELGYLQEQYGRQERRTETAGQQKNEGYQQMLQHCRQLPFGRNREEYRNALAAVEAYRHIWQRVRGLVARLQRQRQEILREQERVEEYELRADEAYAEKRRYLKRLQELEIDIRKYEAYLNSPENRGKAQKREQLKQELGKLRQQLDELKETVLVLCTRRDDILEREAEERAAFQQKLAEELQLQQYFEEELALKLVLEQGTRTLTDCAREANSLLRESDRGRQPEELLQSLYRVYQQHNSNLSAYGTSIEDCFSELENRMAAVRRRVRLVSVWNGKKLYLEEFYQTLKAAIEETELLIREKDRELFEDILSQTVSQQLTDRIAESRKWVQDMSALMKYMDTSMGLSFSLDWKPRTADNEEELDTQELEHILLRDRELLTSEDIERVASHFRSKIKEEKRRLEEDGLAVNYLDLVRDALDYRKWFSFRMSFYRNQEGKKPLTNAAFNRFSGGEKAMAMYVPLFAAVNAQYQKAEKKDHPRIIALDEAFAGVDDKNISSMFELVEKLDFDYIMNSQALWGCYETVKGLKIAELLRPLNDQVITVIYYTWNGQERILDEQ